MKKQSKKRAQIDAKTYKFKTFSRKAHFEKTTIIDGGFAKIEGLPSQKTTENRSANTSKIVK